MTQQRRETRPRSHPNGRPLTREQAVSIAEHYVGAYNDRDLDAMLAVQDPNILSYPTRLAGAKPHTGHDGVRAWWQTMLASGQRYHVAITEIRQLSADRVAIIGDVYDDAERISPWCAVIRIHNSLITESRSYLSDPDLLDRLGLTSEPR